MTQVIHGLTREQLIKRVFGEAKPQEKKGGTQNSTLPRWSNNA